MFPQDIWLRIKKLLFAAAYTSAVLPFTLKFFKQVTGDSSGSTMGTTIFGIIPLESVHQFGLPIFLLILEFTSVELACAYWTEFKASKSARFVLMMFLCCQFFPFFATFYGSMIQNYEMKSLAQADKFKRDSIAADRTLEELRERRAAEDARQKEVAKARQSLIDSNTSARADVKEQIAVLQTAIQTDNDKYLPLYRVPPEYRTPEMQQRFEELQEDIKTDKAQLHDFENQLKTLSVFVPPTIVTDSNVPDSGATGTGTTSGTESSASPALEDSPVDFFLNRFWTRGAILAFGVACVFPTSVFGVGYVLARSSKQSIPLKKLSISAQLGHVASQLKDHQPSYIDALSSVISAYFVGLTASRSLSRDMSLSHLKFEYIDELADEADSLREEIAGSNIENHCKESLIKEIERITTEEIQRKHK